MHSKIKIGKNPHGVLGFWGFGVLGFWPERVDLWPERVDYGSVKVIFRT